MDVKIKRVGDSKILVVNDTKINEKGRFSSKEKPIVLGSIIHFFSSGEYSLSDYRLTDHLIASPYLEEGPELYFPKSQEEKDFVISRLHTYQIRQQDDKEYIVWHRFNSTCFDGDITNPQYSVCARFSYKEAYKRLCEQRDFWLNYQGEDLSSDDVRVENKYLQPSASILNFEYKYPDLK